MPLEYCPKCGARHEYSTSKPKFCSQCGEPFDKAFQRPASVTAATTTASYTYNNSPAQPPPRPAVALDPSSIAVDVTPPQVITLGDLQKNRNTLSFGRAAATRPEVALEGMSSMGEVMSNIVNTMMKDAPRVQALAAANALPTEAPAPKKRATRKSTRRKSK
jgi:hypothetical protein